jgi:predicted RNA-binding protein with TRAM domain
LSEFDASSGFSVFVCDTAAEGGEEVEEEVEEEKEEEEEEEEEKVVAEVEEVGMNGDGDALSSCLVGLLAMALELNVEESV